MNSTHSETSSDDERAVSPVIGVILMVAITVILAAVIGTFVLNLGGQVQENVQAGASVSYDTSDHNVTVTWTSNQNADYLNVNMTGVSDGGDYRLNSVGGTLVTGAGEGDDQCTDDCLIDGNDTEYSSGDTITVVVTAVKGDTQSVIVNKKDTV